MKEKRRRRSKTEERRGEGKRDGDNVEIARWAFSQINPRPETEMGAETQYAGEAGRRVSNSSSHQCE